jgi:hypothetical protein
LNGVHDIGGIDGFGPIPRELDEPVLHEFWATSVGRNESLLIDLWESYLERDRGR